MDTSLVSNNICSLFQNITLIDINADTVTFFKGDDVLKETGKNNYEEYFENLKKVIHPDYTKNYFNSISLNNLDDNVKVINYLKLSENLAYENYIDILKKVDDNKIIIVSINGNLIKNNEKPVIDDDLALNVGNTIVNIENVLDTLNTSNYEIDNLKKYIYNLFDDLKKSESVLKNYQNKVINNVNKVNETLLIADDDSLTRNIFKKIFQNSFNIIEAKNGEEAIEIIDNNLIKNVTSENIVGLFLDLKMPVMDGFGVLDFLNSKNLLKRLPVIIISADDAKETKENVYKYDIADMLEKPFNFELIKKRVNNTINIYNKSNILNDLIRIQYKDLKEILNVYSNSYLIDHKDFNDKMTAFLKVLLEKYNETSKIDVKGILNSSLYYDIGINLIPKTYLNKINSLDDKSKKTIYDYPLWGNIIIKYLDLPNDNIVSKIIMMKNERFDGLGYPNGLKDAEIPAYIYLVNIAIELTSLYYKNPNKLDDSLNIIYQKESSKYSKKSIELIKECYDKIKEIYYKQGV